MSACCDHTDHNATDPRVRLALIIALVINLAMFIIEMGGGAFAQSVGLQADAIDFLGDSMNYGLSLAVLGMAAAWHTRVALVKALAMLVFGLWVWAMIVVHWLAGTVPEAPLMGGIAFMAMLANILCGVILFRFRAQDANMASVWICTRNDVLSNIAVMIAASGVWVSDSGIPDLTVGALIGGLAISGGIQVLRMALAERRLRVDIEDASSVRSQPLSGD
ncbi:MAG: cation transporter [Rhodospirillales bacterium]